MSPDRTRPHNRACMNLITNSRSRVVSGCMLGGTACRAAPAPAAAAVASEVAATVAVAFTHCRTCRRQQQHIMQRTGGRAQAACSCARNSGSIYSLAVLLRAPCQQLGTASVPWRQPVSPVPLQPSTCLGRRFGRLFTSAPSSTTAPFHPPCHMPAPCHPPNHAGYPPTHLQLLLRPARRRRGALALARVPHVANGHGIQVDEKQALLAAAAAPTTFLAAAAPGAPPAATAGIPAELACEWVVVATAQHSTAPVPLWQGAGAMVLAVV